MDVVQPAEALWFGRAWEDQGKLIEGEFRYASNTNTEWLDVGQIQAMITPLEAAYQQGKL
jgi:hypothetical protein